ncbi:cell envelope integrity protein CreD [Rhodanobacter panaciterrae]|uniref:Cell envelope integrity protein CreD n=1 Tax=Rhodanobacter panaciterrae TaxID=490572 RepID=A0ABQ3A398_9GAMM|nr:cell envelope integrity protein CreD [Rhodanobacter panaciterrae]GGY33835.1 cell envelope integrity protein CreD [Rhodanobacter panaciterrae]
MNAWTQTVTAKVLGIGVLALLMTIPLMQVSGLVSERQQLREMAIAQIAQGWGGQQVLGGPVLTVPTLSQVAVAENQPPQTRAGSESMLADTLKMDAVLDVQTRSYGIYTAPVFVSTVKLDTQFRVEDLAQFRRASNAQWQGSKAELRLPIGDLRGLQEVSELRINGKPARFDSSANHVGPWSNVVVPIDLDALADQPIDVEITLKLAGTESLQLLPLARSTDVTMRAPWRDPSFIGAALPLEQAIDAKGFSAHWHMLDLNRNYGQHWTDAGDGMDKALQASTFGVQLYQPVDVYQRNVRAGKYGLLFIAMTFVAFFLFEILKRLRVHPVQYLLVGAALATFYVVLLALSEQIGFGPAYALAAAAVALIVGGYATAVLHARRAGLLLGGVLGLIYAMLYGLIAAEQYALLIGALVLLVMVALMMYLTRRIDWYAYVPTTTGPTSTEPPAPPAAIMERS